MAKQQPREQEQQLIAQMLEFQDDPLSFVLYAFPWGKVNSPLENAKGPRGWQIEALTEMRDHLARNRNKTRQQLDPELLKIAIASGRGIGKSAFLAWIALWLFSCVPRLWSEESPDAFAGVHSQKGMAVLFDEASGIPSVIWPVTQGYFTDKTVHRFWVAISNPRNPSGAFFECFNANRDTWWNRTVDARSVNENDQALYQQIIKQYGTDSDEARVEVYGMFPRQGDQQFISRGEVDDAIAREVDTDNGAPLLMGVDPARFGDDEAVIAFRQGRNADVIPWRKYKRCSTAELASSCAEYIDKYKPDGVFVEGDGVGGGVIDILREYGYRVIEVTAGGGAENKETYANHRTELWGRIRDWLPGSSLPQDSGLADDLAAPMYDYSLKGQLKLEPKDRMKKRGYASPNNADALAMTFSRSVARRDIPTSRIGRKRRQATGMDYDLFA